MTKNMQEVNEKFKTIVTRTHNFRTTLTTHTKLLICEKRLFILFTFSVGKVKNVKMSHHKKSPSL